MNIDENIPNARNVQNVEVKLVYNHYKKDSEDPLEEPLLEHEKYIEKKCFKEFCKIIKKHPFICLMVMILLLIAIIFFISEFDYLILEFIDKCNKIFFRIGQDNKG